MRLNNLLESIDEEEIAFNLDMIDRRIKFNGFKRWYPRSGYTVNARYYGGPVFKLPEGVDKKYEGLCPIIEVKGLRYLDEVKYSIKFSYEPLEATKRGVYGLEDVQFSIDGKTIESTAKSSMNPSKALENVTKMLKQYKQVASKLEVKDPNG